MGERAGELTTGSFPRGERIKLNLGAGSKRLDGYIAVDLANNAYGVAPDVACDIRELPFSDNYADEILAVHVFEHFYMREVDAVLREWKRVLKAGGRLVLELPCLDKVVVWLKHPRLIPQMTLWPLYGDPSTHKGEADLHKWCWSMEMIKGVLTSNGFKNVQIQQPLFHVKERDMRVEGVKP